METSVPAHLSLENVKVKQRNNSSSFEPKIQLPYNWFVSDKDEAERDGAKGKKLISLILAFQPKYDSEKTQYILQT
jgi:hypothetical protein